jgi:protease IV
VAYLDDAIAMAQGLGQVGPGARVVMFRRCNDRAYSQYEITPNIPTGTAIMPLSIPGLDRARMPMFLYLWQPETGLEKIGQQY